MKARLDQKCRIAWFNNHHVLKRAPKSITNISFWYYILYNLYILSITLQLFCNLNVAYCILLRLNSIHEKHIQYVYTIQYTVHYSKVLKLHPKPSSYHYKKDLFYCVKLGMMHVYPGYPVRGATHMWASDGLLTIGWLVLVLSRPLISSGFPVVGPSPRKTSVFTFLPYAYHLVR